MKIECRKRIGQYEETVIFETTEIQDSSSIRKFIEIIRGTLEERIKDDNKA